MCGTFLGRLVCGIVPLDYRMRSTLGLLSDADKLMAYHIGNTTSRLTNLTSIGSSLVASFNRSQEYLYASICLLNDAEQMIQYKKDKNGKDFWPPTWSLPQHYAKIGAPLINAYAQVKLASDRIDQVNAGLQAISDMLVGSGNPVLKTANETRTPVEMMEESRALLVDATTSWRICRTCPDLRVAA